MQGNRTLAIATRREAGTHRLGTGVGLIEQDGAARLLDLERGRFFALDAVGSQLLLGTFAMGPASTARRVSEEYGVPVEQVGRDLQKLLRDLQQKRLVVTGPGLRRLQIPGWFVVAMLLTLAWLCVRLFGWNGTIRLWRRFNGAQEPDRPTADAARTIAAVDQVVRRLAAAHPLNTQCKERALVGWHILRGRYRLPAELVVGVILYPFQAHAWVECGAWHLSDDRSHCDQYIPVARYSC